MAAADINIQILITEGKTAVVWTRLHQGIDLDEER
jgi:hypothetical protein